MELTPIVLSPIVLSLTADWVTGRAAVSDQGAVLD